MKRHAYRRFRAPWLDGGGPARHYGSPDIPAPPPPPEIVFPPLPPLPKFPEITFPEPFDPNAGAAEAERAAQLKALRILEAKRKGYASTLLTGGQGVETPATVRQPGLIPGRGPRAR